MSGGAVWCYYSCSETFVGRWVHRFLLMLLLLLLLLCIDYSDNYCTVASACLPRLLLCPWRRKQAASHLYLVPLWLEPWRRLWSFFPIAISLGVTSLDFANRLHQRGSDVGGPLPVIRLILRICSGMHLQKLTHTGSLVDNGSRIVSILRP